MATLQPNRQLPTRSMLWTWACVVGFMLIVLTLLTALGSLGIIPIVWASVSASILNGGSTVFGFWQVSQNLRSGHILNQPIVTSSTVRPRRHFFLIRGVVAVFLVGAISGIVVSTLIQYKDSPEMLNGHTDIITSLAWSPDGLHLVSGSLDTTVRVWDVSTGHQLLVLKGHGDAVTTVSWSPDGSTIASGSWDKTVKLWDANTGRLKASYNSSAEEVNSVAWSPDSQYLAAGSSLVDQFHKKGTNKKDSIAVWDTNTGKLITTYRNDIYNVHVVAWSSRGDQLASGTDANTIYIRDVFRNATVLPPYKSHFSQIVTIAWSPRTLANQYIVSGSGNCSLADACTAKDRANQGDTSVQVWDTMTGKLIKSYHEEETINAVLWSPDGNYVATASNAVHVWAWKDKSEKPAFTYNGHTNLVYAIAWSPSGGSIASGDANGEVHVWKVKLS